MGPITLFDKSFLQSLTVDESVWFDRFFLTVVCPVFFVETLADLAKQQDRRPAEAEVRIVASKFPEIEGSPCASHVDLAISNLLGAPVPMDGRIPRAGGRYVTGGNRSGVVYDQSPEEAAFHRWQEEKFDELERSFASDWRTALSALDLSALAKSIRDVGIDEKLCKSPDDAKRLADGIVSGTSMPMARLALAARILGVQQQTFPKIVAAWERKGRPSLEAHAPYAAFVLKVELFFYLLLSAGLISTDKKSNRTDIAYLFYLPFCMVFVSSDKLHRRVSGQFLRENQEFVWGPDLKADLARINGHYLSMPEAEREKGLFRLASSPPSEVSVLTRELWKRHLNPRALDDRDMSPALDPEKSKKLVQELNAFTAGAPMKAPPPIGEDVDAMSIQRRIHKKKGSWWQLPKDLPDKNSGDALVDVKTHQTTEKPSRPGQN